MEKFQKILNRIQVSVAELKGRQVTQTELAAIGQMSPRALGEWKRGASAPAGVLAILNLLSALPEASVSRLLEEWRSDSHVQPKADKPRGPGKQD